MGLTSGVTGITCMRANKLNSSYAQLIETTFTQIYFFPMFWVAVICIALWAFLMACRDY